MKVPNKIDIAKVVSFVDTVGPGSKIYIGTDSERIRHKKKWYVDYATVVIIHINGKHGGKIFGAITRELDYDKKQNKPSYRLMNEVYKTAEVFLQLAQVVDIPIEVHMDINPNEDNGSYCVVHQAIGYIKGVCNVEPKIKPVGFAASNAADQLKRIMSYSGSVAELV